MSFTIGENVGPYRIQRQLGQGGMATVYEAYHADLSRHVAVKVLRAELGREKGFAERFKREAQIIANLDNPHIVPIYDFGEHAGQPYFVLKLIDGQTLQSRLISSPLSNSEILEIALAVGDGLEYAHRHGVLHRDIKPSNVLIARDGQIYLSDFGLAKMVGSTSSLTGETVIGTPHYMSPEQVCNIKPLDEGTDIYSFGVMLYEMVVGRLPYDPTDFFPNIGDHAMKPPLLPTSIKPCLANEVEQVLLKALAEKRRDRYEKVVDLVRAFTKVWILNTNQKTVSSTTVESSVVSVLVAENGLAFPLVTDTVRLGRNSSTKNIRNDIDLSELDVNKIISRCHAMVECQDGQYILHDLNSRNGTFLNGKRIAADEHPTLITGDVIELGSGGIKLTFAK